MDNYIIGIDVGASKVCGAVGKTDKFGKLDIEGITSVACAGVSKAVITNIEEVSNSIQQCIKQLENMVECSVNHSFVGLPVGICTITYGKGVVAIDTDDSIINGEHVKRVLDNAKLTARRQGLEIVSIVPVEYIIDGEVNTNVPFGKKSSKLEVEAQIIYADSNIVNDIYKSFNRAGIKIQGLVIEPIGAVEVLLNENEFDKGLVIIDVGADTTDISIFNNRFLCYSKVIPLGGNSISNDIAACLNISIEEAERIKVKYGNIAFVLPEEDELIKVTDLKGNSQDVKYSILSEIIEARVSEILSFIDKEIKTSGFYDDIARILISGGGISMFKGINDLSKEKLSDKAKNVSPEYVGASSPVYSNCLGIVKYASTIISKSKTNKENEESFNTKKTKVKEDDGSFFSKIRNFFGEFF